MTRPMADPIGTDDLVRTGGRTLSPREQRQATADRLAVERGHGHRTKRRKRAAGKKRAAKRNRG